MQAAPGGSPWVGSGMWWKEALGRPEASSTSDSLHDFESLLFSRWASTSPSVKWEEQFSLNHIHRNFLRNVFKVHILDSSSRCPNVVYEHPCNLDVLNFWDPLPQGPRIFPPGFKFEQHYSSAGLPFLPHNQYEGHSWGERVKVMWWVWTGHCSWKWSAIKPLANSLRSSIQLKSLLKHFIPAAMKL